MMLVILRLPDVDVSHKQSSLQLDRFRDDTHLKVFGDHLQCDLEDCLKYCGHFLGHAILQLVDDGRKETQHFCIPAVVHQEECQRNLSQQACPSRNVPAGMSEELVPAGMSQQKCPCRDVLGEMSQEKCSRRNNQEQCPRRNVTGMCPRRNVRGTRPRRNARGTCPRGHVRNTYPRRSARGISPRKNVMLPEP
jgi:hypothetical protein